MLPPDGTHLGVPLLSSMAALTGHRVGGVRSSNPAASGRTKDAERRDAEPDSRVFHTSRWCHLHSDDIRIQEKSPVHLAAHSRLHGRTEKVFELGHPFVSRTTSEEYHQFHLHHRDTSECTLPEAESQ